MTNFEFYKKEIKAIGFNFGIARSGKLLKCSSFPCVDCAFCCNECSEHKFKWLCEEREENKEQPKLTKNERKLCEILQEGYIAKESNGVMAFYKDKPQKIREMYWGVLGSYSNTISDYMFADCDFSFITWEDEEPWKVEDLLKLEVEE